MSSGWRSGGGDDLSEAGGPYVVAVVVSFVDPVVAVFDVVVVFA